MLGLVSQDRLNEFSHDCSFLFQLEQLTEKFRPLPLATPQVCDRWPDILCQNTGRFGYTARIMPREKLENRFDFSHVLGGRTKNSQ